MPELPQTGDERWLCPVSGAVSPSILLKAEFSHGLSGKKKKNFLSLIMFYLFVPKCGFESSLYG